ncbi:hypothetical protein [Lutibacter holmesii]|uniref:hypothetical protein n=1 Tax=Lutibacter holmesii TaxID=1137985 RepID=UPI0036DCE877
MGRFKAWFLNHKNNLIAVTIFSLFGIGYVLFFTSLNVESLLILLPFAFMTVFYVVPIFKKRNIEVSFRNFPGIKIFSIAFAWAGVTVFFPLYEKGFVFNTSVCIEFVQRVLFLIAITLPFDIRDLQLDSKQLRTIPQVLGVKYTKILGTILIVIFVLLGFVQKNNVSTTVIIAIITLLFLWFSNVHKSTFYASFWVEAIPIFWLCLILLFL